MSRADIICPERERVLIAVGKSRFWASNSLTSSEYRIPKKYLKAFFATLSARKIHLHHSCSIDNSKSSDWNIESAITINSVYIRTISNSAIAPPIAAIKPCLGSSTAREAELFEALDEGAVDEVVEVPLVVLVEFTPDSYIVPAFE